MFSHLGELQICTPEDISVQLFNICSANFCILTFACRSEINALHVRPKSGK